MQIFFFATLFFMVTSSQATQQQSALIKEGQQAFQTLCSSCHDSETNQSQRLAPPIFAVKNHYSNDNTDEAAFVKAITDFVTAPNHENAKMLGAIRKFGLMPNLALSEAQVRPIATYIYHSEFVEPRWHQKQHKQSQSAQNQYLQQGQQHALAAKAVLGKNLMTSINTQGTVEALQFCNESAIQLTDGVAGDRKVRIKRVSDQNRNPNNRANSAELTYIEHSKALLKAGQNISGQITDKGDTVVGYYPITINAMCLQCHGQPEQDIAPATAEKIKTLYPNDLATGYDVNELRGIWVIEMDKTNSQ